MNRGPLLVSLLCLTGGVAHGEDLLAVYDRALLNDPQIREAEATRMAAMEAKPQALANLLPQFSGTGNRSRAWSDTTGSTTNVLVNNTTQAINTTGSSVTDTTNANKPMLNQARAPRLRLPKPVSSAAARPNTASIA